MDQLALFTPTTPPRPVVAAPAEVPAFPVPSRYDRTVHAIGRCVVKGCKRRKRNTLPAYLEHSRYGTTTRYGIPTRYGVVEPFSRWDGEAPSIKRLAELYAPTNGEVVDFILAMRRVGWVCPDHDRAMKVVAVEGVVNIDKSCNGQCMSATGPACECACGGENHGARWV